MARAAAAKKDAAPFALELEVVEPEITHGSDETYGPRVRALVHNVAKTGKRILVDYQLQPVELVLIAPSGKTVTPFDERSRKKFDTTRHSWLFRVLGPSSEYAAREDDFRREDGAWTLRFGSFTYSGLEAGTYRAKLRFTSAGNAWRDDDGKSGTYSDLWEGTIESTEAEIVLP